MWSLYYVTSVHYKVVHYNCISPSGPSIIPNFCWLLMILCVCVWGGGINILASPPPVLSNSHQLCPCLYPSPLLLMSLVAIVELYISYCAQTKTPQLFRRLFSSCLFALNIWLFNSCLFFLTYFRFCSFVLVSFQLTLCILWCVHVLKAYNFCSSLVWLVSMF